MRNYLCGSVFSSPANASWGDAVRNQCCQALCGKANLCKGMVVQPAKLSKDRGTRPSALTRRYQPGSGANNRHARFTDALTTYLGKLELRDFRCCLGAWTRFRRPDVAQGGSTPTWLRMLWLLTWTVRKDRTGAEDAQPCGWREVGRPDLKGGAHGREPCALPGLRHARNYAAGCDRRGGFWQGGLGLDKVTNCV